VAVGSTLQLNAVGTFSDGTKQSLNGDFGVGWTVSPANNSIASVSATGLVTGVAVGTATVTAGFGTVTQKVTINVEDVTSLVVGPTATSPISATAVTIAQDTAAEFSAIATLTDGSTQDVTSSVTWVSTAPTIATVSDVSGSSGWATGIAAGTTTIAASFDGAFASDGLTVTNATLSSLAIATPTTAQNIALGASQQYTVTGTFSDSSTQDLSTQVVWTSSDIAVAIIDQYGVATSTGTGSTTITAAGNINGSTANASQTLTVH
jgi:trimeric autotransporter adhesin